ncbi:MAG: hypothetical protein ACO3NZ_02535 [Pirellulales bacterium]
MIDPADTGRHLKPLPRWKWSPVITDRWPLVEIAGSFTAINIPAGIGQRNETCVSFTIITLRN